MSGKDTHSDHTKCVAAHGTAEQFDGALTTPIYQTSNYRFIDSQQLAEMREGRRKGYIYSRYENPTVEAVEEKLAALENAEKGLLFSSGMAATSTTCMSLLSAGDRLLASDSLYGGSIAFFEMLGQRFGVKVEFLKIEEFGHLEKFLAKPARLLWFETPVNPTLQVLDIAEISETCHNHGVLTVLDNTFATPINQKPLDLGIDLVMHSASKYIGGHSDLIGGAIAGPAKLVDKVYDTRKLLGGCADPHLAFLIGRGLKTLAVRVERHNKSARIVAGYLRNHPRVEQVMYPGLSDSPGHEIAKRQMTGFGGMMCLEVSGGLKGAIKVIDSFKLIANATSLGGVESMASMPVLSSHFRQTPEQRRKAGISDGMIRLSVGLESTDEIIADLDQALGE